MINLGIEVKKKKNRRNSMKKYKDEILQLAICQTSLWRMNFLNVTRGM